MPQELLPVVQARERVLAATGLVDTERLPILDALGRVLAEDILAVGDSPPFPCSAMDGYAIVSGPAGRELEVAGESRAGAPCPFALEPNQAVRISTGAVIPEGADAVLRQEDSQGGDGRILAGAATAPGQNIRYSGEDMRAGTRVLASGTMLGPAELGAAAAAGAGTARVHARPRVAVLCTGDELVEPGRALAPGQIHNSNATMLVAQARQAGAWAPPALLLADDPRATAAALSEAMQGADVVVVAGGVSVGPHDHVKPALETLGVREEFWGVALQPGKPTWFGTREGQLVFGLPGNPVSAFVTFVLFVAPALGALQGRRASGPAAQAVLGSPVRRNPARDQAVRVRVVLEEAGDARLVAVPTGPQGSHIVTSLVGADALALVPRGEGELAAGDRVELPAWLRDGPGQG